MSFYDSIFRLLIAYLKNPINEIQYNYIILLWHLTTSLLDIMAYYDFF